eukprot:COSAG02_NODE_12884_length_1477_cov_0.809869_2_plen_316_part_01
MALLQLYVRKPWKYEHRVHPERVAAPATEDAAQANLRKGKLKLSRTVKDLTFAIAADQRNLHSLSTRHADKLHGFRRLERVAEANQISLVIVFLAYPQISNTIFTFFSCRDLDFGTSQHVYDTSIDCNSDGYQAMWWVALILLMLLPIGIPTMFSYVLYKNRETLAEGTSKDIDMDLFMKTMRGLSKCTGPVQDDHLKQMFEEVDVDKSGKISMEELWLFVVSDVCNHPSSQAFIKPDYIELTKRNRNANAWWRRSRAELKFLVRAYENQYYWYEMVQFLKKFLLAGVLVFCDPGSVSQLWFGLMLSFGFFAILTK